MASIFGQIMLQTLYYGIVAVLSIGVCSLLLKGFFWKYVKVRSSFGKLILVKIRTPLRDFFAVGYIRDSFLIFKLDKKERRLAIDQNKKLFYRSLAVTWVDVDEEKGALSTVDYSAVTGFDAVKYNNLYVRALTQPQVAKNMDRLLIFGIIGLCVGLVIVIYLVYINQQNIKLVLEQLPALQNALATAKGSVTGSSTTI